MTLAPVAIGQRLTGVRRATTRGRRPWVLLVAALAVVVVVITPLVFLGLEAAGAGIDTVAHLMFRSYTVTLIWNTVRLLLVVTVLCTIVGTAAAWLVVRTNLPLRRMWAVLVVVPLAIPDFVVSWGWSSRSTWVSGFHGSVLVMTLAVYPLVYLPVAAAFRDADPGQEEVARSLGVSRARIFWRITLGQARGAIAGGAILVALVVLAEYGAFENLAYQTFTTEIFTEFRNQYNIAAACALSVVLVALSAVLIGGDAVVRRRSHAARSGPLAQRRTPPQRLGKATLPALLGMLGLVVLALGVPVGSSILWMFQGGSENLSGDSLLSAALTTAGYGVGAGALATAMALPVALLAVRHPTRLRFLLERSTLVVLAVPGLVIALALSYFTERHADGFGYQTAPLLVIAYAIMFFPLALVAVRSSVAQAPVNVEDMARSLGRSNLLVLCRVTLPLVGPGLAAAFSLVFLEVVTELTATLILIPTNAQTLATQFWAYQTNLSYGQAAPFALVMIGVAAVPTYVLGRFFDRLPSRAAA